MSSGYHLCLLRQSDEVMEDDTYLGIGLADIDIAQSSTDEPPTQTNDSKIVMGDLGQVTDEIPLISREGAQTMTAEDVFAFIKRKLESAEQGSAQKKPRTEASVPTHITVSQNPEAQRFANPREQVRQELVDFRDVQNPRNTYCRVTSYSQASAFLPGN